MPNIITAKLDVTKILKEHLFQGKNGAKYLDIVLIPSKESRFGDSHMIVQSIPKELRDQGQKGPILGNAKEKAGEGVQADAPPARKGPTERQLANQDDDPDLDIPF